MGIKCPKCHFENPDGTNFCSNCEAPLAILEKTPDSQTETLKVPLSELTNRSIFARRYEVIKELGEGGMGKVYMVVDREINETVALKLIKQEIADDKETLVRFRNELKFARKISHRNVCRMYDLNKEDYTYFITMEYVPGEDLKNTIRKKKITIKRALLLAKQICEGLAEAHRLGVVHRDLKPQNIIIDKKGNAHIMDFGIACSIKAKGVTETGVIIGTPDYMSPEQVEGKLIDPRSDIYSLGVILYEMVTGRKPFEGETPLNIAVKHKTEPPPDPRIFNALIPEAISRVILKCMEKDIERRYQGAGELIAELENVKNELLTSDIDLFIPKDHPQRLLAAGILILIAAIIVAGYFFINRFLQKEKSEKLSMLVKKSTEKPQTLALQSGSIEINSKPTGADVYFNGKHEGRTPFERKISPGTYKIRLNKGPKYKERSDVLEIKVGETISKHYSLSPLKIEPRFGYIKKASKEREGIKSKWDNWQAGMKSDFMEVEKLDKSTAYTVQEKKTAWGQFLDNYKADNPYSTEDEQMRQRATQRLKALSELDIAVRVRMSLRPVAGSLSEKEVGEMLKRKNFFSKRYDWNKNYCNPRGDFANEYEVKTIRGDKVILDHATGLMWHQSGSGKMTYYKVKQWVDELNRRGYAGYSDWRLPTLEEGASVLERREMNGNLYIDPLFSAEQRHIWTSDTVSGASWMWFVDFLIGNVYWLNSPSSKFVRPVRSVQK